MNFTHGIVAVCPNTGDLLHFVGYWEKPGVSDYLSLNRELKVDEELGMVGTEFILIPAPADVVELFAENREKLGWVERD